MASSLYYVNVSPADTGATDAHCAVEIWNPSSVRTISLLEASYFAVGTPGAGMGFVTRRSTARGTAGSTITPTAEHHARREAAPDSAFVIDLAAFSVQPTLAAGELAPCWVAAAVAASGFIYPVPRGIEIPPGTGLCFVNRAAIVFQDGEWGFVIEEM
jgi:hypothetical protein